MTSRRHFLASVALASSTGLAGCNGQTLQRTRGQERPTQTSTAKSTTSTATPKHSVEPFVQSGSGTSDDPWVVDAAAAMEEPDELTFDTGHYTAEQFETPDEVDYNEVSYYFSGEGVRNTSLIKQPTDGHFIRFDDGREDEFGNFGGASDMGIYGGKTTHGEQSAGNLIHSTGLMIDFLFENLIVRYSYDDGIHLEAPASGVRIRNCWIENHDGWAIWLGGGTRAKIDNHHILSCADGGMHLDSNTTQVDGISTYQCSPGIEVGGVDNQLSNLYFEKCDVALHADGDRNKFSHVEAGGGKVVVTGVENVFTDVTDADVRDTGTRTLVNGRGRNDGHPGTTGQWNGHADYAFETGATVWDTADQQPYVADSHGNWVAVTTSAA